MGHLLRRGFGSVLQGWLPWTRARTLECERSFIKEFALEEETRSQHLEVVLGERTVEIGKFLTRPEREWLAGAGRAWLSSG
jgi:hypothetical protein